MSVKKGTPVAGVVPPEAMVTVTETPAAPDPTTAAGWREKAESLAGEGESAAAVLAFRKALLLEPSDQAARFQAAECLLFDLEQPKDSLALLEATPMSAWSSDLMYLRARSLAELDRKAEGLAFYQRALEIMKPNEYPQKSRAEIHCSWSLDLRDLGRVPDALPIAERAAAADPVYAHAWECLGYFQYLAKDVESALQSLALAVALEQEMADTFREDPDYGDWGKDPRYVAMLKTKELTPGARELVPTLWPKGLGAHDALPGFLAAVKRYVKPG